MVNWNNESTVTIKTQELYEKCVLEKWYNVLEIFEYYQIKVNEGLDVNIDKIRYRILTLYRAVLGDIKKFKGKKEMIKIKSLIYKSKTINDYENCFDEISIFLTEARILGSKRDRVYDHDKPIDLDADVVEEKEEDDSNIIGESL